MSWRRLTGIVFTAVAATLVITTLAWLYGESRWQRWQPKDPAHAFTEGAIGLETLPLKYALVLETVSGVAFRTGTEDGRSLWDTYGFLPNPRAANDTSPACEANAANKLPFGFAVSTFIPSTAVQTPVKFGGLTCAACHSARLKTADGRTFGPLVGMGNQELDIIAWSDSVRSAVLDPDLSAKKIIDAYERQCGAPTGLVDRTLGRAIERLVISSWLSGIRSTVAADLSRYDLPFSGSALKDAHHIPAGPGRTRPFRSIVRVALNLPAADNMALSKIPVVFEQDIELRPRSQYDGSIANPVTRSYVAAYASGASVEALSKPEIVHNIKAAARFTETLSAGSGAPSYRDLFGASSIEPAQAAAGFAVYMRYCNDCHGHRPLAGGRWSFDGATRRHQLSPIGSAGIGTDAARLTFRYAEMLPLAIWTSIPGWAEQLDSQKAALQRAADAARSAGNPALQYFWDDKLAQIELASRKYRLGHPLYFAQKELFYEVGYINNPIPFTFLRAPYLHNGSIPTLRQLINLDERPARFCRGENVYDPAAVGFVTSPPDAAGLCPNRTSFSYDTRQPGNSNRGHDYPWRFDDPARDSRALRDLLEYLKTL